MNSKQPVVKCQYCNGFAKLVYGDFIYPHRPDLKNKAFYHCSNGHPSSYVGCHKGTIQPMGVLANAELRKAKSAAHKAFDGLWLNKVMTRPKAYAWLAGQMRLPKSQTHIGMFSVEQCKKVVQLVENYLESKGIENEYIN